ncbi:undecaprenyl-diphosphate phosphatase [Alcaligenaceae bacterium SJ-26]|nr:undecaprenyl-diphosphate phosphatase [Alcaligenaceae bacterium SJ-26]
MDWLQVFVLSVVQGITEFLPVSSSAHLILVPVFFDWPDQGLYFDVALHVGSLIAVLLYFRDEIGAMIRGFVRSITTRTLDADGKLAWAIVLGTIPVGLAGLLLKDVVSSYARSPHWIAWGVIVFGLLLGWADWKFRGERTERDMTWKDVAIIGCAQALALFPGTSRSGITLTAALMVGMSREAAARFSFLLSIPVIVLAGGLEAIEIVRQPQAINWMPVLGGVVISGVTAYACIHYFLAFIRRMGVQVFVAYRIVLGIVLLSMF